MTRQESHLLSSPPSARWTNPINEPAWKLHPVTAAMSLSLSLSIREKKRKRGSKAKGCAVWCHLQERGKWLGKSETRRKKGEQGEWTRRAQVVTGNHHYHYILFSHSSRKWHERDENEGLQSELHDLFSWTPRHWLHCQSNWSLHSRPFAPALTPLSLVPFLSLSLSLSLSSTRCQCSVQWVDKRAGNHRCRGEWLLLYQLIPLLRRNVLLPSLFFYTSSKDTGGKRWKGEKRLDGRRRRRKQQRDTPTGRLESLTHSVFLLRWSVMVCKSHEARRGAHTQHTVQSPIVSPQTDFCFSLPSVSGPASCHCCTLRLRPGWAQKERISHNVSFCFYLLIMNSMQQV